MDFIKIIRSLEELLYEVMGWLIFYPRTLWRILTNPARATAYSDSEQGDIPEDRYSDTLSPPLLLMITIVLTHAVATSVGVAAPQTSNEMGQMLVGTTRNLLLLRALIFAIIPLTIACLSLWRRGIAIDRLTLREPFYSQCFLLTPFALIAEIGLVLLSVLEGSGWGAAVGVGAIGWFLWAQMLWVAREHGASRGRAWGMATGFVFVALLLSLVSFVAVAISI